MGLYAKKAELCRIFGVAKPVVYERVEGIRKEISSGRYTRYAISDRLVNKAVFLDYNTYHKQLNDKNVRKYVPEFDICEAVKYLGEYDVWGKRDEDKHEIQ